VGEYVGGYTDWVRQRKPVAVVTAAAKPSPPPTPARAPKKRRLSFKETAELAALPDRIDAAEHERERLYLSLADPAVLRDGAAVTDAKARLASTEAELAELIARWEALETIAADAE